MPEGKSGRGRKKGKAVAAKAAAARTGSRELSREELEALRRKLQRKFH
jgi:hypothetical protein